MRGCQYCGTDDARWRQIRGGRWVLFNLELLESDAHPAEAFVPVRRAGVTEYVPIGELSAHRLDGVRWYAVRHRCAGYLRALAEKRYGVASLSEMLGG